MSYEHLDLNFLAYYSSTKERTSFKTTSPESTTVRLSTLNVMLIPQKNFDF